MMETETGLRAPALPGVQLTPSMRRVLRAHVWPTSGPGSQGVLVGPGAKALTKLVVSGAVTVVLATQLLGHEVSAGAAAVVTWWTLMFCAGSPSQPFGRSLEALARPAVALLLLCSVATLMPGVRSRPAELVLLGATAIGCTVLTELGARAARRLTRSATAARSLVVVGSATQVNAVATELSRPAAPHWQVVASCRPEDSDATTDPSAGPTSRITETARQYDADGVLVLPTSGLDAAELRRLSWELERDGRDFLLDTGLLDVARRRTAVLQEGGLGMMHVRPAARRGASPAMKAFFDRVGAIGLLVVLGPLMLAIAATIRLDSPGPAVFKQCRVGRDGKHFTIYKFRTMRTDAELVKAELADGNESDEVLFKIRKDPRITRVGGTLRKYSLDELPQLFNVVLGQMSLVGPRPALPQEVSQYSLDPRRRLVVKPGITGLWQVSGRSDLSWEETVRRDVEYVDNWSIGLDLSILWRTIAAVVLHRGAY